jgi:uncharacterized protein YukE
MSMADQFGVRPAKLRDVAGDVDAVREQLANVVSGLRAQLDAVGPAWGDDSTGAQFADGSEGYVAQAQGVQGSAAVMVDFFDNVGPLLQQVADAVEQADGA